MSVEDFIIYVYCCVEDICLTIVNQPLRSISDKRKAGKQPGASGYGREQKIAIVMAHELKTVPGFWLL